MSTHTAVGSREVAREVTANDFANQIEKNKFPLSRLSTSSLFRSLILSTVFSRPTLFKPSFLILRIIANSKSALLNPDKNLLLRICLKPLIYDQFCAGTNRAEVQNTVADIKRLGFSGVILCYGKELQVDQNEKLLGSVGYNLKVPDAEINQWREGNLQTLSMIGEGDWLGIK